MIFSGRQFYLLIQASGVKKSLKAIIPRLSSIRRFGQPAAQTHPHLIAEGEVTPGLTKQEFHQRRCNLVKSALQTFKGMNSVRHHLFIIPSATTVYMTNEIPYPFRQNTDFLYFCGFQEPDSLLLIEAKTDNKSVSTGEHVSHLFVPRKDAAKELWDGPRSGANGAMTLTGVDNAFNSTETEKYLQFYNKEHKDFVLWYNHSKPVHTDFHTRIISQLMHEHRHKYLENVSELSQNIRLLKSPAEIQLMQQSAKIASEAFAEVMAFSKPQVMDLTIIISKVFFLKVNYAVFITFKVNYALFITFFAVLLRK